MLGHDNVYCKGYTDSNDHLFHCSIHSNEVAAKMKPNYFEICTALLMLLAVLVLAWLIVPKANQSTINKEINHEYDSESVYHDGSIRTTNNSNGLIY